MNAQIIKSVPKDKFEDVSIEVDGWQEKFLSLIREHRKIKYDIYTMPTISDELRKELVKSNYTELILESDHSQHFLIPKSN